MECYPGCVCDTCHLAVGEGGHDGTHVPRTLAQTWVGNGGGDEFHVMDEYVDTNSCIEREMRVRDVFTDALYGWCAHMHDK